VVKAAQFKSLLEVRESLVSDVQTTSSGKKKGVNVLHAHQTKTVVYISILVTTTLAHLQSKSMVNLECEEFNFQN